MVPKPPSRRAAHRFLRGPEGWRLPSLTPTTASNGHAGEPRAALDSAAQGPPLDLSDPRLVTPTGRAAREAAASVDPWAVPEPKATALREAIGRATGRPVDEVFVGRGAGAVVQALCLILLRDGDRVLVSSPSWPSLTRAALVAGARYVDLGRDQHMRVRQDNLERVLEEPPPRLALLADPDPVTGVSPPEELYRRLGAAGVTVIVDRSCAPSPRDQPPISPGRGANQRSRGAEEPGTPEGLEPTRVFVDSLSVRAGLGADPLGWALAPPAVIDALHRAFPVCSVSGPARAAGLVTLGDPVALAAAATSWSRRRRRLEEALAPERSLSVSESTGPSLWVRHRGARAEELARALAAQGVLVAARPDDPTWHDGVSLNAPPEQQLPRAIRALRRAFSSLAARPR